MTDNKWSADADPHLNREAGTYENPIPSREFIMAFLDERAKPVSLEILLSTFELSGEEAQIALERRLGAMIRDGQLIQNRRGAYGLVDKMSLIRGLIIGNREGFGLVKPDDDSAPLYLSARQMYQVLPGDRVLVRETGTVDRRGRKEATIVEVIERNTEQIVGRFYFEDGVAFVVPENTAISQDIVIPPEERAGAVEGQYVVVEITTQPTRRHHAVGRIKEVLGEDNAPGIEIEVAIRSHNLPHEWPEAVLAELKQIPKEVPATAAKGRKDLRDLPLVTIDGADAKDFDDAVYCEPKKSGGWRLVVAIADVSHYIQPGTALDKQANERGTSVYFPGQVIPMLPEYLSNGLCSLNPHVDRLAMVCDMSISAKGKLTRYRFYRAIFQSHARLIYDEVASWLLNKTEPDTNSKKLLPHLEHLYDLYKTLKVTRGQRGAIDFETRETKILFDKNRKIDRIVPTERNDAHKIIEECMIMANVAAAQFISKYKLPCLYRVHEGSTGDKLENFKSFTKALGLPFPDRRKPQPSDYAELLKVASTRPDFNLIQTVALRSLTQAVYSPENLGHFGLALSHYGHFTSPIRRYPDLLVHRAIGYIVDHGEAAQFMYSHNDMVKLGQYCSAMERRADEATRDAVAWLKCEYMEDKLGEEFDAHITGVTGFGVFVELHSIYVEGLVHISDLNNDYYHFDATRHRLTGERSGKIYQLGDKLKVKLVRVDMSEKKIDFVLAGSHS